ncbi:MAG: dipicolinate synthase subunit B [Coprococcus sp.]|nr:dipicolinate synthase subunit B [Coprococcus sp.]
MDLSKCNIGIAITGSFCTFDKVKKEIKKMADMGMELYPIFSINSAGLDTRFGEADSFKDEVEKITGRKGIYTIQEAEPIGPKAYLDALVIAPCTGNTIAKLANGITDTPVLMAAKAHIRNNKPLIISISTNDAMGINFKNVGQLMNMKNIYFVPFFQDDPVKKPNSLIGRLELIPDTIMAALDGRQLQPVLCCK